MRFGMQVLAGVSLAMAAASVAEARQALDPFRRGTVELEFGVSPMIESWNLNDRRESLVEGTVSMWAAAGRGVSFGLVFDHLQVFQKTPGAFVQGFSPLVRIRFLRHESWHGFFDTGPGISWSDLDTPPRGSKFNYLYQGSLGVMRRLGPSGQMSFGARFLHVSNNARYGHARNPDFEMIGPFASFSIMF